MRASAPPRITALRAIPVAGRDSMLLKRSGAHGPFFTRKLLLLTDCAGRTGVAEVPGGERICQTLQDAAPLVVGQGLGRHQQVLRSVQKAFATATAAAAATASRPLICAPPSTPWQRSNRHCSTCSASTWTCRWPPGWARASSVIRCRCRATCSTWAITARPTRLTAATQQPGRGIALDMAEADKACQIYLQHGLGARNDAAAMQQLVSNWAFNPSNPAWCAEARPGL